MTGRDMTVLVLSGVIAGVAGDSATLSWATNEGEGDASGSQPVTPSGPKPDQAISGVPDGD